MYVKASGALVLCVLVHMVKSETGADLQCLATYTSGISVTFDSRRNQTGHWISQVGLDHDENQNFRDLWSLNLKLNTKTCNGKKSTRSVVINISESNKTKIPSDYELFTGVGYYKIHSKAVTWPRARQMCAEEGTNLAIVNSENEANVLKQLLTRFPREKIPESSFYDTIWVGAYEQGANGQYFTIFGDPLNTTGFTRWFPGYPLHKGTDECIGIHRQNGALHDCPCTETALFVCEIQL